ncbi:MAG: dihydroorotase [Synechococcus sp.]|nr:dihydroorotase [Synechococcus sp.]
MHEATPTLLRRVNLLEAAARPARSADVLIRNGRIESLGPVGTTAPAPAVAAGIDPTARADSTATADPTPTAEPGTNPAGWAAAGLRVVAADHLWLAPPLVDPHSVLEEPLLGRAETLASLAEAAALGGYGSVALLPWGSPWRDRPDQLGLHWREPLRLHLWGSFSQGGADAALAGHGDQLQAGAIGLAATAALPPVALLERGLRLGELGDRPLLLAPRDPSLSRGGFVRERVEALRAGWPTDPVLSETLPLETLLALAAALPAASLRLMNLSTAEAVQRLEREPCPPPASVCWWHLLADSGNLDPADQGWRLEPSLGGPADRAALITALETGLISSVAVHHQPLDHEEMLLSPDQRRCGLAGHRRAGQAGVLPALWRELVQRHHWPPQRLWERLCWGPARFLGLEPERLQPGSRRWILFDPTAGTDGELQPRGSLAANHGVPPGGGQGAIVASGLRGAAGWWAPGFPSC